VRSPGPQVGHATFRWQEHTMTRTIPILILANEPWYIDHRLQEARRVSNPHESMTLDELCLCLSLEGRLER